MGHGGELRMGKSNAWERASLVSRPRPAFRHYYVLQATRAGRGLGTRLGESNAWGRTMHGGRAVCVCVCGGEGRGGSCV